MRKGSEMLAELSQMGWWQRKDSYIIIIVIYYRITVFSRCNISYLTILKKGI